MAECNSSSIPLLSPLRYPGGKAFLCPYVEEFLKHNSLRPRLFVEPFAGGASVSLHLLGKNLVDSVALYDKDPIVASFWATVFAEASWLRKKVRRAKVTLDEWNKQRTTALNGSRTNAWKCLFLNRTSFSGILESRAGPIGGKAQESSYKIGCRFYRETTEERLKNLWDYRGKVVEVNRCDWRDTIARYKALPKKRRVGCLIYPDPPFFHKADRLYNYCFEISDHESVIKELSSLGIPWLLSYDHCSEAIALFRRYGLHYRHVPVQYTSSSQRKRSQKKELVASNLPLPRPRMKLPSF